MVINPISDYVLNVIKTLLVLGHIEIRRDDGSPAQHVTGWFDIEQLSRKPVWIQFIAHRMAETIGQRVQRELKTVVLTGNSTQAIVFGNMLAAKLSENNRCIDIQTAQMRVSTGSERHRVTMNPDGYMTAERIVIADVASFTLGTLQQLLRHVKDDRHGTKQPEIIVACGLRLCRDGIDPSTSTLLGATVCIGYEHIIQQFAKLSRCTQCAEKVPVTHVHDPKNGFHVHDAKKEKKEEEARKNAVKAAKNRDNAYHASIAAGQRPPPPMASAMPTLNQLLVDPNVVAQLAREDEAFLAIPVGQRTSKMVPKGRLSKEA